MFFFKDYSQFFALKWHSGLVCLATCITILFCFNVDMTIKPNREPLIQTKRALLEASNSHAILCNVARYSHQLHNYSCQHLHLAISGRFSTISRIYFRRIIIIQCNKEKVSIIEIFKSTHQII